jgi:hypothetical protein
MLATDTDLLIQLDQRPVWDKTTESCPAGGRELFCTASVEISRLKIIRRMAAVGANRKLPISLPSFRSAPIPAVRMTSNRKVRPVARHLSVDHQSA